MAAAGPVQASPGVPFSRYEVIIDRKPFGYIPPAPPPPPPSVPPDKSFAKHIKLTALIESDDGVLKVGFTDTQAKKDYFEIVGGKPFDGIELLDADYEKGEVRMKKGLETVVIDFSSGFTQVNSQGENSGGKTAMRQPVKTVRKVSARRPDYVLRRRQRMKNLEERRKKATKAREERNKLSAEELQTHLQEYQMEVIRSGMPALPIPLTQEMDDQLVAEGVLPPAEDDLVPGGSGTPVWPTTPTQETTTQETTTQEELTQEELTQEELTQEIDEQLVAEGILPPLPGGY